MADRVLFCNNHPTNPDYVSTLYVPSGVSAFPFPIKDRTGVENSYLYGPFKIKDLVKWYWRVKSWTVTVHIETASIPFTLPTYSDLFDPAFWGGFGDNPGVTGGDSATLEITGGDATGVFTSEVSTDGFTGERYLSFEGLTLNQTDGDDFSIFEGNTVFAGFSLVHSFPDYTLPGTLSGGPLSFIGSSINTFAVHKIVRNSPVAKNTGVNQYFLASGLPSQGISFLEEPLTGMKNASFGVTVYPTLIIDGQIFAISPNAKWSGTNAENTQDSDGNWSGITTTGPEGGTSVEYKITMTPLEYWPYKGKDGNPIYDAAGAQLQDPEA